MLLRVHSHIYTLRKWPFILFTHTMNLLEYVHLAA